MESVIQAFKRRDSEARIFYLRQELDWNLELLYKAMKARNKWETHMIKEHLIDIRRELIELEEL